MPRFVVLTNDLQVAAAKKHPQRQMAVDAFLPRQISFLQRMRTFGVPIVHLQLIVSDDDPRSADLPDTMQFRRGSAGSQILKEVYESGDVIIEKPKDSGFFQTSLDDVLRSLEVDTVILTGMQTQICVQTTAADAHFRGYKVIVPSDGVVSSRPEDTQQALHWMANYCATVMTSDKIEDFVQQELVSGDRS
jgi:nicotinamidase-related amidase